MNFSAIFPGSGIAYNGNEISRAAGNQGFLYQKIESARNHLRSFDDSIYDQLSNGQTADELQSQYSTYIISCAFSDILKYHNVPIHSCCGYSMGVYAALYHAQAISFEDGLKIIEKAYELLAAAAGEGNHAMGFVIGIPFNDVRNGISRYAPAIELINVNNEYGTVIAGVREKVESFLAQMTAQGAFKTSLLPLSIPYHCSFLRVVSGDIRSFLGTLRLLDAVKPVLSTIDCRWLTDRYDIANFIADNLYTGINWHAAMIRAIESGTRCFVECGPGNSLKKIARFIPGDSAVLDLEGAISSVQPVAKAPSVSLKV